MDVGTWRGLGVAMITPFKKDESIDFAALERLTDYLINGNVNYLVVLGTTGETPTLSDEEQEEIFKCVKSAAGGRIPLVKGLGGNNTAKVVKQLKDMDTDGVSAILSVAPYYNKPTQEGHYRHFEAIAHATKVPVILYNIPGRTGVNMTADTTLRLAHQFEQFVGIKEASCNLDQMKQIVDERPANFIVTSGDDGLTLPLARLGGDGIISVIGNAFPAYFSKIVTMALNGQIEEAEGLYKSLVPFTDLLFVDGNPPGVKAVMHAMGMIENVMRLPIVPATDITYTKLKTLVDSRTFE